MGSMDRASTEITGGLTVRSEVRWIETLRDLGGRVAHDELILSKIQNADSPMHILLQPSARFVGAFLHCPQWDLIARQTTPKESLKSW
jgi:hypothetical protein